VESRATVTLHVGNNAADDVASIELVVTNSSGEPISQVAIGETFEVRAYVRDLRTAALNPGVSAAYLDVLYDPAIASVNSSDDGFGFDVFFMPDFGTFRQGQATIPGLIDEIGAARNLPPTDAGPAEVFRVTFTARATGTATFTGDPADIAVLHNVQLADSVGKVAIDKVTYGTASVQVVTTIATPLRNAQNPSDVNADGKVTPLDALLITNELNAKGSHAVANGQSEPASQSATSTPAHYFDVSGDNRITPLDALLVITYLNQRGPEGEADWADDELGELIDLIAGG
jgi:hypothetical protein